MVQFTEAEAALLFELAERGAEDMAYYSSKYGDEYTYGDLKEIDEKLEAFNRLNAQPWRRV